MHTSNHKKRLTATATATARMAEEDKVVLLDFWSSPFGTRVRIALREKGIKYESREENLKNKSPLLLKMNHVHQKIPVLIHNGKPICESLIIVEYIDEVWHGRFPLLPSNPYERAQARFWADYVDKKIYPIGRAVCMTEGGAQEEAKKELIQCFKILEEELGNKTYFGGEMFGIVDVTLIPFYSWFYAFETSGNFKMAAECPKLVSWAMRCIERESVSKSLPDSHKVYDFILELKKAEAGITKSITK